MDKVTSSEEIFDRRVMSTRAGASTAPTPAPTTAPSPEPTPTPEPPAHPRIVAVTESPSPWGPHWRRITLSLADVGEGTALTLTAHGRFGYCGPRCDPHPRRVHRLLVRWADVVGRETITMDFHPDSDVALRFELLPPDGTEAGDTVATHVIRAETD